MEPMDPSQFFNDYVVPTVAEWQTPAWQSNALPHTQRETSRTSVAR
jgi:hypothetical protein